MEIRNVKFREEAKVNINYIKEKAQIEINAINNDLNESVLRKLVHNIGVGNFVGTCSSLNAHKELKNKLVIYGEAIDVCDSIIKTIEFLEEYDDGIIPEESPIRFWPFTEKVKEF